MNEPTRRPKLSVVIPAYNEVETIQEILRRVAAVRIDKEIVVVDDFSTDGTRDVLRRLETSLDSLLAESNLRVFYQDRNQGKGAALRRAFTEALGEIVLVQDADLEYNPEDYGVMLDPFERGLAAVVYGSRFSGELTACCFSGTPSGNRFLTLLSNMFTNLNLTYVWEGVTKRSERGAGEHGDSGRSLRDRAGNHGKNSARQVADFRGSDFLLRPDVRPGQKNYLEGWVPGAGVRYTLQRSDTRP